MSAKPLPRLTYAEREAVAKVVRQRLALPLSLLPYESHEELLAAEQLLKSAAEKLEDGL